MCGVAGTLSFRKIKDPTDVRSMLHHLQHRGPDGFGLWENEWLSMGHRRLSIVDPIPRSNQPMLAPNGDAIVFNGEIYNFKELRSKLIEKSDNLFVTESDTEVLLKGLSQFGIQFLNEVDGDFAFAYFSKKENACYLVRDRFGVKPLFWSAKPNSVIFASEIKPILASNVSAELNEETIQQYFQFRYVKDRHETAFKGIHRIGPGEWVRYSSNGDRTSGAYWNTSDLGHSPSSDSNHHFKQQTFESLFSEAVRTRLNSDGPTSVLLSGGVDSSAIAVNASAFSTLHSYTADTGSNEVDVIAAQRLAGDLKLKNELVDVKILRSHNLQKCILALEEPLGDSILEPTSRLFKAARASGKVALSGEGADEIFGTYVHHKALAALDQMPGSLSGLAGALLGSISSLSFINPYPANFGGEGIARLKLALQAKSLNQRHEYLSSVMLPDEVQSLLTNSVKTQFAEAEMKTFNDILIHDIQHWLPNYGLTRVDRLSMKHALEVRVPFLSHKLVDFVMSNKDRQIFFRTSDKRILRNTLKGSPAIHSSLAKRKKYPFMYALKSSDDVGYLKWMHESLSSKKINQFGFLNPKKVEQLLALPNSFVQSKKVLTVLNFQIWCETFLTGQWQHISRD